MVFTFTIRETLNANTIVTIAGKPSGTAATAREIAVINISIMSLFCNTAIPNSNTHKNTETPLNTFPKSANLFCNGVVSTGAFCIILAIFPISVSMPMAVTTPSPLPYVTLVDIYALLFFLVSLITGRDSPVRAASSIFRFTAEVSCKSAGT